MSVITERITSRNHSFSRKLTIFFNRNFINRSLYPLLCPKIKPLYLTRIESIVYKKYILRSAGLLVLESGKIPKMEQWRLFLMVAVPGPELNFTHYNHSTRCT